MSLHVQLGETQRITKAKEDEESRTAKSMLKMRTKIVELTADPSQGTADDCILQLVGKGFGCPRTMRLHSAEWRNKIMAEYGTDVRKARQMVEHLASRFNIQMEGPLAPATRRCKCSRRARVVRLHARRLQRPLPQRRTRRLPIYIV